MEAGGGGCRLGEGKGGRDMMENMDTEEVEISRD